MDINNARKYAKRERLRELIDGAKTLNDLKDCFQAFLIKEDW